MSKIRVALLDYQLKKAGLPIVGVASTGRIDYSREVTAEEEQLASQIVLAHNPNDLTPHERDIKNRETGYALLGKIGAIINLFRRTT